VTQIGLFCGTFNPIHMGHLLVAECAGDQFKLDRVIFVTSARPPHRSDVFLPSQARHDMVVKAVSGNSRFEASTIELDREGPSYTVDSIRQFRETYGEGCGLNLLIGGDNIIHLRSWYKVDEIFKSCRLLIAPRFSEGPSDGVHATMHDGTNQMTLERPLNPLSDLERQVLKGARYEIIQFPFVEISSSTIRKRIQEGRSILYMVPSAVDDIIKRKGYYAELAKDRVDKIVENPGGNR
jgi:nicotinate-nucleotide adenylyltransferase